MLFYGLPHGVDVKGPEAAVRLLPAEQIKCFVLGRGGEGEKGEIAVPPLRGQLLPYLVLPALFAGFFLAFQPGVFIQGGLGIGQRGFELQGRPTRLGGMGFVHNDGKVAAAVFHFLEYDREFLQGGDDDGRALVDGVPQLGGVFVYGLHQPFHLLKLADGSLQLSVQHPAVGHDNDGLKNLAILRVM